MTRSLSMLPLILGLAIAALPAFPAAAPKPGAAAPAFDLPDLANAKNAVSLASLEGKVVLVDFWASWCPPCKKTLPHLGRLRQRHPGLAVVAISVDEDRKKAADFLKPRDTAVVFLHDAERSAAEAYDPGGMPSLFLIDRKGVLRYRHDGYTERDMQAIEAEIRKLAGEP
jgi:thiol-disulfide isomerase/thioredoxin